MQQQPKWSRKGRLDVGGMQCGDKSPFLISVSIIIEAACLADTTLGTYVHIGILG
jgi:hypothetical protein